jgi:hypothetical protein
MNDLFEYIDSLPKIPSDLISEVIKSAIVNENIFFFQYYENYKVYHATDDLKKFIEPFFKNHGIFVHVMKNNLKIHKDVGRKIAFNYIIDNGGTDVETCFYNNSLKLIQKIKIEKNRWHKMNVEVLHNVINLTTYRIAITVTPK